ncbi:hypothetical protein D9758_017660 [Tetrapyrgos nigripes]|uniref:Uncharacterized protein n=1 Tax=Tetrapyrgos nigripes TaxID=182062 RepID=A0A8H5FEE9_9AGAR|nr:hypothetical protein D9758_017660 [Tetrapyrgos nigripes]
MIILVYSTRSAPPLNTSSMSNYHQESPLTDVEGLHFRYPTLSPTPPDGSRHHGAVAFQRLPAVSVPSSVLASTSSRERSPSRTATSTLPKPGSAKYNAMSGVTFRPGSPVKTDRQFSFGSHDEEGDIADNEVTDRTDTKRSRKPTKKMLETVVIEISTESESEQVRKKIQVKEKVMPKSSGKTRGSTKSSYDLDLSTHPRSNDTVDPAPSGPKHQRSATKRKADITGVSELPQRRSTRLRLAEDSKVNDPSETLEYVDTPERQLSPSLQSPKGPTASNPAQGSTNEDHTLESVADGSIEYFFSSAWL